MKRAIAAAVMLGCLAGGRGHARALTAGPVDVVKAALQSIVEVQNGQFAGGVQAKNLERFGNAVLEQQVGQGLCVYLLAVRLTGYKVVKASAKTCDATVDAELYCAEGTVSVRFTLVKKDEWYIASYAPAAK